MSEPRTLTGRRLLMLAAWCGLLAGLVEGLGLYSFEKRGWLNWNMTTVWNGPEMLWNSPLWDLLLFSAVGVLLLLAGKLIPFLRETRVAVAVFGFLVFFDWLAFSGRIRNLGVLLLAAGLTAIWSRWFPRHESGVFRLVRKTLPVLAAVFLLLLAGVEGRKRLEEQRALAQVPAPRPGAPNILIIMEDTLRADHVHTYGYARNTTPNIDRLAQQGVLFSNAYSTSSWTLPAHASVLTGRYPGEHGAVLRRLDGRLPTLGETFQARGYRTAGISANLLYFTHHQGFARGFIHFEDDLQTVADLAYHSLYGRKIDQLILLPLGQINIPARKRAAQVTDAALRWQARDPGRPFFMFLNYFDAHTPYLPPQPYRGMFAKIPNPGGLLNWGFGKGPAYPPLTPEQQQSEMDAYDGAVAYMDAHIGRLLEELERRGVLRNTIVVVMSDHGEFFGEHGLLHHRNALYREGVHIPLIFLWPGHVPAGVRVDRPVSVVAIAATLMNLLGEQKLETFRGPSLMQEWTSPASLDDPAPPVAELTKFPYEDVRHPCRYGEMKSLFSGRWHYIEHETQGTQLYDLHVDLQEQHDLAHGLEPGVAEDMHKRLQELVGEMKGARQERAAKP